MKETVPGAEKAHSLSVENRARAVVSGVEEVDLFNEQMIVASTTGGTITLAGQGLHVEALDLEKGMLVVDGRIDQAEYGDRAPKAKGVLGRIFR